LSSATLCTDLAGNALQAVPPQVQFRISTTAPAVPSSKGFAMRFANPFLEEIAGGSGTSAKDIRGQFLYNSAGFIRPRVPVRFPMAADRSQPFINKMLPIPGGVITPLSALGSRLHHLYRYTEVGMSISETDDAGMNIDIEGLALSPLNGQVVSAFFPQFEIRLAHAAMLPDEIVNPVTAFPTEPASGLRTTFSDNILNDPIGPQKVVHPRAKGFAVSPSQVFQSATGVPLLRMPLNVGATLDAEKQFYTWRDTAVLSRPNVTGVTPSQYGVPFGEEKLLLGLPLTPPTANSMFNSTVPPPAGGIPSVGLPLLIEYRCYPTETVSLNIFDISIAVQTQNTPAFRAFSTGGVNQNGVSITVNPDNEPTAKGGFNGNPTVGAIGAATPAIDPTVYIGQLDAVLRVSRVYTRVKNTGLANPTYRAVVLEPRPENQPPGTSLTLAYRGGTASETNQAATSTATALNVYGNHLATAAQNQNLGGRPWLNFQQLTQQANYQYLQTRFTFISNTATQLSPILESYAVAYQ
jgi:hypothetical protein